MTKKEVIEKLYELGLTPAKYEYFEDEVFEGFTFSEELQDLIKRKDEAFKLYRATHTEEARTAWSKIPVYDKAKENEFLEFHGIGEMNIVSKWGGEGEGDRYGFVVHIPKFDYYLEADGDYASYSGSDMSYAKWYSVIPQEKIIIEYVADK